MSVSPSRITLAYLAQGRIRVKEAGDAPPRTIDSVYGNSIREKAVRSQQKNSWKGQGDGSPFSGPVLWGKAAMPTEVPLAITSICAGRDPGGLVYSLESGSLCALLEVGRLGTEERRLWNDNRTRVRHVTVSPQNGDMVFSILHQNSTANIGIKLNGESGIKEITEGDSFDTAPHWVPGDGRRLVFQSAGIGRNREGHFLAFGPFSIQQLDVDTAEMTTLIESNEFDYLAPRGLPDGSLLYIRRPYTAHHRAGFLQILKDAVLFPFRLTYAVFQFLNFFSALFTGRKLTSAGGAKAREMDMKQMMIWGNLVRARQPANPEEEGADLVPKSWELYLRNPDGRTRVLANGVLAYDVSAGGSIAYTNGSAIFLLHPDGQKDRVLSERMIEQVFFVPTGGQES